MKICWDNIKDLYISNRGNLRIGTTTYMEMDSCSYCGDPYLAKREPHGWSKFCSFRCYGSKKIGTKHTEDTKKKISISNIGRKSPMSGKKHSYYARKKISEKQIGSKHHNYKGNVTALKLPLFDTYDKKINYAEDTRFIYKKGLKLLQVRCAKCRVWFTPDTGAVNRRIRVLEGQKGGGCRFYCSNTCRQLCDVYGQTLYPKNFNNKNYSSYELSIWRKEVLSRTNYKCEYCGKDGTNAHHIKPKKLEPFFALDPDYGLSCCGECHYKYGHRDECATSMLSGIICGGGN